MKNSSDIRLIIAVVHDNDSEAILQALLDDKYGVTRIASTGGFLRRGSTTLLIGVPAERVKSAIQLIRDYSAPSMTPGMRRASIFVMKVDRFEQL